MYKISTLNKISNKGLEIFSENYQLTEDLSSSVGILLRSHNLHDTEFSNTLLAIARAGAGVNNIPVEKCAQEGIVVFNTPGANANAVKELVIAGMLIGARNIYDGITWASTLSDDIGKDVEKGKGQFAGSEISGKTLGVIGLGAIGILVANAAISLGMNVIGYDPFFSTKSALALSSQVKICDNMNALLNASDFVTLHLPASDKTAGIIGREALSQIKTGAILLNFSRDKLVDEKELLNYLDQGVIAKYISDFPNSITLGHKNAILIPHLGASTKEAEDNCAIMAVNQLMDYIENGNITNSVNFPQCNLGKVPCGKTRISILTKVDESSCSGEIATLLASKGIPVSNMVMNSNSNYISILLDTDIDSKNTDLNEDKLIDILSCSNIIKSRIIRG